LSDIVPSHRKTPKKTSNSSKQPVNQRIHDLITRKKIHRSYIKSPLTRSGDEHDCGRSLRAKKAATVISKVRGLASLVEAATRSASLIEA